MITLLIVDKGPTKESMAWFPPSLGEILESTTVNAAWWRQEAGINDLPLNTGNSQELTSEGKEGDF